MKWICLCVVPFFVISFQTSCKEPETTSGLQTWGCVGDDCPEKDLRAIEREALSLWSKKVKWKVSHAVKTVLPEKPGQAFPKKIVADEIVCFRNVKGQLFAFDKPIIWSEAAEFSLKQIHFSDNSVNVSLVGNFYHADGISIVESEDNALIEMTFSNKKARSYPGSQESGFEQLSNLKSFDVAPSKSKYLKDPFFIWKYRRWVDLDPYVCGNEYATGQKVYTDANKVPLTKEIDTAYVKKHAQKYINLIVCEAVRNVTKTDLDCREKSLD